MLDDSRKEVSVSLPAVADSPRPIQVFSYPPVPGVKPVPSLELVELFLRELSTEPHENDFYCDSCGRRYTIAAQEGKSCTRPMEGGFVCTGRVTRRWTKEKVEPELRRLLSQPGTAVAWELARLSVPVAFAVCEAHSSETVIAAIGDFPMTVLSDIYGRFGRYEPFLVLTHLWVDRVASSQETEVVRKLLDETTESIMRIRDLQKAIVLVPVSVRDSDLRRQTLNAMLAGKRQMHSRGTRSGRHRELLGFEIKRTDD